MVVGTYNKMMDVFVFKANQPCVQREDFEYFVKQYNQGSGDLVLNLMNFVDICSGAVNNHKFELVHFTLDHTDAEK